MSDEVVDDRLLDLGLSILGSSMARRDRLLRGLLKQVEPEYPNIPWYSTDFYVDREEIEDRTPLSDDLPELSSDDETQYTELEASGDRDDYVEDPENVRTNGDEFPREENVRSTDGLTKRRREEDEDSNVYREENEELDRELLQIEQKTSEQENVGEGNAHVSTTPSTQNALTVTATVGGSTSATPNLGLIKPDVLSTGARVTTAQHRLVQYFQRNPELFTFVQDRMKGPEPPLPDSTPFVLKQPLRPLGALAWEVRKLRPKARAPGTPEVWATPAPFPVSYVDALEEEEKTEEPIEYEPLSEEEQRAYEQLRETLNKTGRKYQEKEDENAAEKEKSRAQAADAAREKKLREQEEAAFQAKESNRQLVARLVAAKKAHELELQTMMQRENDALLELNRVRDELARLRAQQVRKTEAKQPSKAGIRLSSASVNQKISEVAPPREIRGGKKDPRRDENRSGETMPRKELPRREDSPRRGDRELRRASNRERVISPLGRPTPKRTLEKGPLESDDSEDIESDFSVVSYKRGKRVLYDPSLSHDNAAQTKAVKVLKDWGLKFSGEDPKEDPEELLERLKDCKKSMTISDGDFLRALPCIFSRCASRWFRTAKKNMSVWSDFSKDFRRYFIGTYDRHDLDNDLKRRTHGPREKIAPYISSIKYILSRYREEPDKKSTLITAWANLRPSYRRGMKQYRRNIRSLEDIEHYGRVHERELELDRRYALPPPPEKMRVPGAAYTGGGTKEKVAAIDRELDDDEIRGEVVSSKKKSSKKEKRAQKRAAKSSNSSSGSEKENKKPKKKKAKVAAVKQAAPPKQPVTTRQPATGNGKQPPQAGYGPAAGGAQYRAGAGYNPGFNAGYSAGYQGRSPGWLGSRSNWANGGPPRNRYTPPSAPPPKGANNSRGAWPPRRGNGANRGEFLGACYTCQELGHRAAQCPQIQCYRCRGKGHTANECPERLETPRLQCQLCDGFGHTAKFCSQRNPPSHQGNWQVGRQK